ncbi:MAG: RidA family protein [Chitinophagales bacterium]|jgi:2-iminobutanoate/2-iminopropanoate deaminase|nr:RidA family protein [Chitinophagales bacterium]HNI43239.1 RidA family protein [Chitinophagales bacterium]
MKEIISTSKAPAPIGPYNQATRAGGFLFISGQIALDPATGNLVEGGVEQEAEQVMKNLQHILQAAGASFEQVVKTTIFLTTMDNFARVNAVYGQYFNETTAPARETVAVVGLPRSVQVEISMVAYLY